MPASTRSDSLAIRGALFIRVIGWWMCCLSLIGLAVATVDSGAIAFLFVGVLWTTPAFWWGWRISHLGVFAEPDTLVICNPLRTIRIRYNDIADVRMFSRFSAGRASPRVLQVFNRRVGIVVVKGRDKPIEIQATDWLWSTRSLLGHSTARSDDAVDAVRSVWLGRRSL